jgi:hypothetical protein
VLAELDSGVDSRIDRRPQIFDHRLDAPLHIVRILARQQSDVESDGAPVGNLVVLGAAVDRADVEDRSSGQQWVRLVRECRFQLT